ncbi:MAG: nickel pincer cofactor biosynthesis protein LarC [Ruminococcus sp.]|nr:nickel pincer cofactor biosynthesis protein LarC [Ruminococcus sp.]MCM1381087.1 nickel pincer cofactor biosynthesis protein LarC [Muribaculaceae bacterium]MCM1479694.1 nickel pincer cofactor biosynthesis protein LarC [Muribaculaceae bacterium]
MKTLYLDCSMGAAGDMLAAALLELIPDGDKFIEELDALGIPDVSVTKETSVKCGVTGTHFSVKVHGEEEESVDVHHHEHHCHGEEHHHHHEHHHGGHHHSSMHDIEHIVGGHLNLPQKVREDVTAVYSLIAEAESKVHGKPVTEIHFHEVGAMDAVADITAVCLLMNKIAPDRVVVSPVCTGSGQVRCAHGILPVPAPATAHILRDVPIYGGNIQGELCTPTGAALLKHFADGFGNMPVMTVQKIGYGMGKKDFEAANCVRAMLGESGDFCNNGDTVTELSCNLDDMTGEAIGFAMETLLTAGALDVYTVPIGMKKSRTGVMLCTLCRSSDKNKIAELIFKHTTTIGIRENTFSRYTLSRTEENIETPYGAVRKKISSGYGVKREKFEFEDIAVIARKNEMSLSEVTEKIK